MKQAGVVRRIDDLENINDYNENTYHLFYENAIKKAVIQSGEKNIIIGSCINPTDFEKVKIPKEIEFYKLVLSTCSDKEVSETSQGIVEFIKNESIQL